MYIQLCSSRDNLTNLHSTFLIRWNSKAHPNTTNNNSTTNFLSNPHKTNKHKRVTITLDL